MQTSFYITISIQTAEGPVPFGRFELGNDREAVLHLFSRLKGSEEINGKDMLYMELLETVEGLPVNMDVRTCSLQELAGNAMLITQEVFRLSNLKCQ